MSMPLSPTKLFVCDGCGATLPLEGTIPGQKCRCRGCGGEKGGGSCSVENFGMTAKPWACIHS